MGRHRFLLSVLFLIAGTLVYATFPFTPVRAEEKTATVATLEDYRPYCFRIKGSKPLPLEEIPPESDSIQLQGFSWDVVRESLHETGYTIRLIVVPWERAMAYVKQGKADVLFPAAMTEERQKTLAYAREIVNRAKYVVYIPAQRDIRWNGLDSLRGRRIAVIRGWSYGPEWRKNEDILKEPSDDILQCFQMLDRNRVFGVAGYDLVFDHVLKEHRIQGKYRKLPPFDGNNEYLAGDRTNPLALRILEDFDRGKRRITKSGLLGKITSKWR